MQILFPIAGLGTRVRPHTHVRPKPMLSLAGKPVLGHQLDHLMQLKPSSLILVIAERADATEFEAYIGNNYHVPVQIRRQAAPRGQSHAIAMAADLITEPLLVVFGDTLFEADMSELMDPAVDGSIVVHEVDDPRRFGVIELENGLITRLHEKPELPPSNLALIGVYMLNDYRGLLNAVDWQMQNNQSLQGEFFIAGALQRMIDQGSRFKAVVAPGWWDTGTIQAVLDAHRHLVAQHPLGPGPGSLAQIVEPCSIDPSAVLQRCVIGPYVTIGARSRITDSVISDSILGEDVELSSQVLRNSVIGNNVVLEGRTLSYNIADHSWSYLVGDDEDS